MVVLRMSIRLPSPFASGLLDGRFAPWALLACLVPLQARATLEPAPEPELRATSFHGLVVENTGGRPLAGVEVRAHGRRTLVATDAEGRFELPFESVPATHSLVANGYRRLDFEIDGDHASIDSAALFRLERIARLEVVVYDERGRPLKGARVVLRSGGADRPVPSALISLAEEEWSIETDGSGRCRFRDLPADRELRATVLEGDRELRRIEWPLSIGAGEQLSVGWIVDRGRDRVGLLQSLEGEALSGVRLWLLANDDGPFERRRPRHLSEADFDLPLREVVTDADGRFELPELQHGWYRIGPAPGGDHVPLAVALEHDLRDDPTRIELDAACGVMVTGRVRASDGAALAGAVVFVEQPGVAGVLSARCDDAGRFELSAVPDAELRVLARDERFGFESRVVTLPAGTRELELRFD
jgi:carboxypeptidase family protein